MNLFLAVIWLMVALVLFLWPWLIPGAREPTVFDSGIPLSWLALVMALYSLSRWWTTCALLRQQQAVRQDERRRVRARAHWQREPDPTFDFTEGPPPRKPAPPDGST